MLNRPLAITQQNQVVDRLGDVRKITHVFKQLPGVCADKPFDRNLIGLGLTPGTVTTPKGLEP